MKKLLILIVTIFLTSGCYDYVELNDLSIISGIAVDYKDDKYVVTYEILNDQKKQDSISEKAIIVSKSGKTIAEAFNNTTEEIAKKPYYAHLKCVVISEEIAGYKLENLIDYFLRKTDIRSEFDTVIAKDISAKKLLDSNNKNNPVISDLIESLLENNKYYKNNTKTNPFEEMVTDILIFGEEAKMAVIKKDDDNLKIDGIGLFNDYKLQGIITKDNAITYNVLTGNALNASYTTKCNNNNNETLTFAIYESKPKININNNKININVKADANIVESNCNYNFKDTKTYEKLNKEYSKLLEKKINKFITTTLELDSDILGIRRIYYNKYRIKNNDIWKLLDYKVNVDFKINKKGLIFEVNNDN